jgi:hypothetical protein
MSIQSEAAERRVVLSEVPKEQAKKLLSDESESALELGDGAIPKFTQLDGYHGFKAEYAIIRGDIVLHFFLPKHAQVNSPEARQAWMSYWLKDFPAKLDPVAQEYFEANHPRLMAKYTSEVASWWFKAQGFGEVLDVGEFVGGFLKKLDEALQVRS